MVQVVLIDPVDAHPAGLRLELSEDLVPDARLRGGEGPAPHLEHPPKVPVRRGVALEGEAKLPPRLRELQELLLVNYHRRRPDWIDLIWVEVLADDRLELRGVILVRHVVEPESYGHARSRKIGQHLQEEMVRLHEQDVLLGDLGKVRKLQELAYAPRSVHDDEPVITRVAVSVGELGNQHRGNLVHQPIRSRPRRVQQPCETTEVRARVLRLELLVVIVCDAGLPLLVGP